MKKTMSILLVLLVSMSVNAQLTHTKWKGTIKGDNPQEGTLKFTKDTLVLYAADGSVIETMTCKIADNVFSVKKVTGQSDCDTHTAGSYKFVIKAGTMSLSLASDACGDRSSALDKTQWVKISSTH
jgi:hypothetical protein